MAQSAKEPPPRRQRPRFGEELVVFAIHRHWYWLARASFPFVIILGGLAVALSIAPAREFLLDNMRPLVYLLVVIPGLGLLWHFLEWARSSYILTPRRIVRRERGLLFYEWRQEIPLDQVMNVALLPSHPLEALLHFDDLAIELYQGEPVILPMVPEAERVRSLILGQVSQFRALERRRSQRSTPAEGKPMPQVEAEASATLPPVHLPPSEANLWRRHPMALIRAGAPALILLVGAAYLGVVLALEDFSWRPAIGLCLGAAAMALTWIVWEWLAWRGEGYAIAQGHLFHLKKAPFGKPRILAACRLVDIQNISGLTPGVLAWLLGYGEIRVELAHPQGTFVLKDIARPQRLRELIFQGLREIRGDPFGRPQDIGSPDKGRSPWNRA